MSKSVINQRQVFKLHSKLFAKNNWSVNLSLEEAMRGEQIVKLGDSETLRMIRKITGNDYPEEEIFKIKSKIKRLKKDKDGARNREKLSGLYKELNDKTIIEEYLLIVFDTIADWNHAKKHGVTLNGYKYKRLVGTSGGIKNNTVVFCREFDNGIAIRDEVDRRMNNGRNTTKKYIPAKFEAYKALSCSNSTPVPQPRGVLVIKDGVVNIKDNVLQLTGNEKGGFDLNQVENYEIERQFTDGCGMIRKELAEQWAIALGEKDFEGKARYIPSGFNIRNAWTKGMVFTFPFEEFAEEVAHNYMVQDVWGNMVDIREVDLVITTNMLKLWDAYDSYEHYDKCCKENGYGYCVAKILPEKLESVRNMNYQFLQSYDFTDEDIQELIKPTVEAIEGALSGDYGKTLLFLKGCKITERDFLNEDFNYMKALMIEPKMKDDPFIKQKTLKMIRKRINDAKKGVIQVEGNYSIVSGDLYALCQSMFNMEITGILGAKEYYSWSWLEKGVDEIVAFRAPMTLHNNIRKFKLINNELTRKWYRYMPVVTILNAWDTTVDALNGCDFDGDAIISTNNPVLLRRTKDLPVVVCEQKSANKKKITEANLCRANKGGFNNSVGTVTNECTGMNDIKAKVQYSKELTDEIMYRITCMQGYQQEIIDSCKGIVPKKVPAEWHSRKALEGMLEETEEQIHRKNMFRELLCDKKPYFFIYNYPHEKYRYDKYNESKEVIAIRNFSMTLKDLLNKENKTEEEQRFYKEYVDYCPVSLANSTMNRICWALEDKLDKDIKKNLFKAEFDSDILNPRVRYSEELAEQIKILLKNYGKDCRNLINEGRQEGRGSIISHYKEEVLSLCNNEDKIISIFIDHFYSSNTSKQIVWDICGDNLVDYLLKANNNQINIPILDKDGVIIWNGQRYSLVKREVEIND